MEKVETKYSVRDGGHYVPAMRYRDVLYISGQLSIDPETGKVPEGGIQSEAKQALANLDMVLKEAGVERKDVIQCRVYIPDVSYWGALNQVYSEFFGDHKPARIVVPTNKLYNNCLVEVEAIAACGREQ